MKKKVFLAGLVIVLFSCNSGGKKESSESKSESRSEKASSKSDGKSYDCLKDYKDEYEALLTKEEMASVHSISDKAKVELRSGSYGEHIYRWESDRPSFTMEVSNMKMEVPDQNTLGIKNLSFYSDKTDLKSAVGTFDMGYKELSDKELEQIQSNLDKAEDEVKKTGEDFMKVRAKMSWNAVDGLGSSAWYKWSDQWGGELVVLAGRANFTILTKMSADPDENRRLAIQLAEKVLAKCK
ncbi:hypothetical protein M8845_15945 [Gelidibacter japonicus]|uniref:hypothetical protein n=1 Tax=Gelidibacter japonicus TaxID=1962232 RepID=UPI0020216832|nr:hypothetical protein [Gelidibacter japonicus]MCL8008924.1 hypothetical protein [Gelidibacter japonicus]